jgi:thioredoxin 2
MVNMAETTTATQSKASYTNNSSVVVRCATCSTLNRVDLGRIADRPRCSRCANALPLDRPLAATDADFQKFLDGARVPVLVDFYADWCGPCKAMAPTLEAFARQHAGNVLVLKLNTDSSPATARRFNIASIPTLVLFRNGAEVKRQAGAVPRSVLEQLISS